MEINNQNDLFCQELVEEFIKNYGGNEKDVSVFVSPGRINIIGEHIDYNGGNVFPTTIDRYIYVAIRKRTDSKVLYRDLRFPEKYEFDITWIPDYDRENGYANYLNGILVQLMEQGFVFESGFEILMSGTIPFGGGVSSSSALEIGFGYAVSKTFGFCISRIELAFIGQLSEHRFMNVNCGIMDQFVIATCRKNYAELLNCSSNSFEFIPLNLGEYRFVLMNTNKPRKLCESKYNERREECERALKILQDEGCGILALCDLTQNKWNEWKRVVNDEVLRRRVEHCVSENERVLKCVDAMKSGDLDVFGKLLNESHKSLKENYEVTGRELDVITEAARTFKDCLGARMTGAGFGGCAIAFVHKDSVKEFEQHVNQIYSQEIGYSAGFFICESGPGVFQLK